MDENKLKIGDVVRLKSGGPKMTITGQEMKTWKDPLTNMVHYGVKDFNGNTSNLRCSYFNNNEVRTVYFPPEALDLINQVTCSRKQTLHQGNGYDYGVWYDGVWHDCPPTPKVDVIWDNTTTCTLT